MTEPIPDRDVASTVYVIDDDRAVRDSLHRLFSSANLPVKTYACAKDFLITLSPEMAGCVVLDVRMPGMTGFELQRCLSKRSIDVPVVMITGHGSPALARRAKRAGAFDFMVKPLDGQDVLNVVAMAIDAGRKIHRRDDRPN